MVPIGGKPVLEHLVCLLRDAGITDIAINLHYRPEAITRHFGDGSSLGVHITYSPEEHLLGSAGAVKRLSWFLNEPFIVIYGDVMAGVHLAPLIQLHSMRGALATLALYEVPDPSRCGIVQTDADGRVRHFIEKPQADYGNLANAGIYVLSPEIHDHLPEGPSDFGHEIFPDLLRKQLPVYAAPAIGYVMDIGSPERYEQVQADYAAGLVEMKS